MKGLFDNHNHSQFSFDGKKTSVEASALSARSKGLGESASVIIATFM